MTRTIRWTSVPGEEIFVKSKGRINKGIFRHPSLLERAKNSKRNGEKWQTKRSTSSGSGIENCPAIQMTRNSLGIIIPTGKSWGNDELGNLTDLELTGGGKHIKWGTLLSEPALVLLVGSPRLKRRSQQSWNKFIARNQVWTEWWIDRSH